MVHASGTGSRGPRVGRGSRLAGPRPGTGDLAGPGPRARRAARLEEYEDYDPAHRGGAGRDPARRPPTSCSPSRRPPPVDAARASPARRGCSPASRPARRPRSARGWPSTCCPAARSWRSPPTPPPGDDRFAGVSEAELVGVVCAWDRVEAHAAARKLAAVAELDRRNPGPAEDASSPRIRSRARWGSPGSALMSCWVPPGTWTPTCPAPGGAARRHGEPGQGPADRHRHRPAR